MRGRQVAAKVERYKRYDLEEVAQMLGVDLATVRRWVEHGMLPTLQIGSRHLVKGADLFLMGLVGEPSAQVQIDLERSQFNAPGNDNENLRQQYVCFVNHGSSAVDMGSWHVQDRTGATYDFGSFTLKPGATVCLRTGKGTDSETDLYWGRGSSVWRNEGDTVSLFDRLWNVVDRKAYGEDAEG